MNIGQRGLHSISHTIAEGLLGGEGPPLPETESTASTEYPIRARSDVSSPAPASDFHEFSLSAGQPELCNPLKHCGVPSLINQGQEVACL